LLLLKAAFSHRMIGMVATNISRLLLLAAFALASAVFPCVSQAEEQYCATRYMPGQETACFRTKAQAEQYIRTEPATPIGNAFLEKNEDRQLGPGQFLWTYHVKPKAPSFQGDYYRAQFLGKGRGCGEDTPGVTAPDNTVWCDDEDKLAEDIKKSRLFYEGVQILGGSYSGGYYLGEPTGWSAHYEYVYHYRNLPSNDPQARTYNVQVTPTIVHSWGVTRVDWYQCPATFNGGYPGSGVKWPLVCFNGARGEIVWRSKQHDSCCKDGNPAVASTGNKEYRETDFEWEGGAFARAYNSINDMALNSGLTANWAHSFSTRLVMYNGWPSTLIRSDGYYEYPSWDSATSSYGSANRTGVVLVKEPDEVAATRGRWRLSSNSGELLWFDDSGRLSSFDRGGRSFFLDYCADADVQSGACLAVGDLLRVRSPSGRTLTFGYLSAMSATPADNGVRISRISADGVIQIEYAYDAQGRLIHASKGGVGAGEGLDYIYAEPAHLCRTAGGASIAGCDLSLFPNHMTGVIDENGQRFATYDYDDYGRVTVSDHVDGAGKVTLTYESNGGTSVALPTGAIKRYTFSTEAFRQPTETVMATTDGSTAGTTSAAYSNFRRQWSYDARGFKTEYAYDSFHETSRRESIAPNGLSIPSTRTTQTDWVPSYSLPSERRILDNANALVAKSKWTYNDRGQALTSTQVDPATAIERTVTTAYCDPSDVTAGMCPVVGAVKSVDGPRSDVNDVANYTYYANDDAACATSPATCAYRKGDLWKITNSLGHVTEFLRYDYSGRLLSSKDANGVVTDMEYLPRGWLASTKVRGTNASSETDDVIIRYKYDLIGQVKKVIQPDGAFIRYEYDAAHRLTDIYDNAGNRIHYTLDAAGARTKEDTRDSSGALKRTLSRIYNQLGQLKTAKTAYDHPTGFTYDASGNGDVTTDALGRKVDNDYDPLNRLAKTLQDVGGINAKTEFKYDALDRLTKVTDPKNLDTTYAYNGFGDQVQLTSPDTGVSTYTYDSAGNRKTETDARNITRTYSYDALNRPIAVAYPTTSLNVGYEYDAVPTFCAAGETFAKGRLSLITDASGSTQYCYDRFGRMVRKVQTTNGKVFVVRYAYTLAGQLSSLTYPDGAVVTYQRDAQGRISQIDTKRAVAGATTEVLLSQATYHPFGPTAGWTYGNGRTFARPVDLDYRTTAVIDPSAGGLSVGFGFDAVGNIDKLTPPGATNALLTFGYDALNRLTALRDGPTNTAIEAYTYDATGNRQSVTTAAGTKTYTYPTDSHRLAQAGLDSPRSYDASGNSIQIGGNSFIYNDAGRSSELKQGATLVQTYVYNAKGEQVRKYTAANDRYTIYDETGHWLGDYNSNGNVIQQAIWMDGLPVGLWVGNDAQQALHYIEPDHLGTPRVVIDPVRNATVWGWDLKGEAFGNSPPNQDPDQDGIGFVFDMRLPGQRYDANSGLSYNYFRNYDAAVGRYAESDPIGLFGGISSYGYVSARPLIGSDFFGLSDLELGDHKTGQTIDCGKGCSIRIDFRLDMKSGLKIRHLHWECRNSEGECGEFGKTSHKGSWDDAPSHVQQCALRNGFKGQSTSEAPPQGRIVIPEMTPGAKAATVGGAILLIVGGAIAWVFGG
jgi:RHS repeat-associated protein